MPQFLNFIASTLKEVDGANRERAAQAAERQQDQNQKKGKMNEVLNQIARLVEEASQDLQQFGAKIKMNRYLGEHNIPYLDCEISEHGDNLVPADVVRFNFSFDSQGNLRTSQIQKLDGEEPFLLEFVDPATPGDVSTPRPQAVIEKAIENYIRLNKR